MDFPFSIGARDLLTKLTDAGYAACAVGGCVRDFLRGVPPHDLDLATSATPAQMQAVFSKERVIETGLKHGTLTVLSHGEPFEITTFRVDGAYTDGRHPDTVHFTKQLTDDLSRRDFTINAMAYTLDGQLVDPFGGQADLAQKRLRCVGDAQTRFTEDALRILRLLRFASTLQFQIDPATEEAAKQCAPRLAMVSVERIATELCKLLCGADVRRILCGYPQILCEILPELSPLYGFDQHNPHHCFDLMTHTAVVTAQVPPEKVLRLAALFHDIGKPATFSIGADGYGHFYQHAARSAEMADAILRRLHTDNATRERVTLLIRHHDGVIAPTPVSVRRKLARMGEEAFRQLLQLQRADNLGLAPQYHSRQADYDRLDALLAQVLAQKPCISSRSLAINGDTLQSVGFARGKRIGIILSDLLEQVLTEALPNQPEPLLAYALQKYGAERDN